MPVAGAAGGASMRSKAPRRRNRLIRSAQRAGRSSDGCGGGIEKPRVVASSQFTEIGERNGD
eukprot:4699653-Prymnesium_polylepis.1